MLKNLHFKRYQCDLLTHNALSLLTNPQTDVIVNTIADHANLSRGAVSAAILSAAGPQLQSAASLEAGGTRLTFGDVIVTDGYNLNCQKVFHAVCPFYGAGQAEEVNSFVKIKTKVLRKSGLDIVLSKLKTRA